MFILNENLDFWGSLYSVFGDKLRQEKRRILEIVALEDRACHLVKTFSGGMKRRANIACALIYSPRILLADEPTVGVDRNRATISLIHEGPKRPRDDHHLYDALH